MDKILRLSSFTRLPLLIVVLLTQMKTSLYSQEDDSLSLQLFNQNDLDNSGSKATKTIVSANRLAETPDDMAQQVIIIDGATIRKFGYTTLVDVLESIPGFRTSQPGNSIEGETFLMRGLYGNDHVKFLINGVPIKPEAVKGMPIGGQLPIRHAERIEIILGPSSASYGSESMAGVINIVLPEIDRPVFAWADINLLSPKTTDFNLTLGGKAGKGKSILNYELFASSYRSSDINLLLPDDSIRVKPNQLNAIQQQLFVGDSAGVPERDNLKRESRLLGAYITYKGFEMSVINMYREEHSGLGSQPLQHAYYDASLTYGENINSIGFKYNSNAGKRFQTRIALSSIIYRTITNSAYYGVTHLLSNGRNFMYARSTDLNLDLQEIIKVNKQINLAVGLTGEYAFSQPFTNFLRHPYDPKNPDEFRNSLETAVTQSAAIQSISMLDTIQSMDIFGKLVFSAFAQASYRSKSGKFSAEAGIRWDAFGVQINDSISYDTNVFSPKLGIVYKPISNLKFRAYYGSGYRAPKSYYIYNNYGVSAVNFGQGERLKREIANIKSERLDGIDVGVDWQATRFWKLGVTYFAHWMNNKVLRQINIPSPDSTNMNPNERISFGYYNGNSKSFLQSLIIVNDLRFKTGNVGWNLQLSYELSKGKESVKARGDVTENSSTGYRFVPTHAGKGNLEVNYRDLTVSLRGTVTGRFITDIFRSNNSIVYTKSDVVFCNVDLLIYKQLFRQLSVFGGVYNLLNTVQSGIPNVDISNTWNYNPQYGRVFKIGLTFKLN